MKKDSLRKLFNALTGRTPVDDTASYKLALAENIVGLLEDNDFIVKANRMVIGCASGCYEEALEDSKVDIIRHLKNQGGAMRGLAGRIDFEDGIEVRIEAAPEGVDVKIIPGGILPVEVWFFLEKVQEKAPQLTISRGNWKEALSPEKRYTIGRSKESRDTSIMMTLPDAGKAISRWQVELICLDSTWYCKSVSEKCPTFVDDRFAEGDVLVPLRNVKNGGQIKFGMGSAGFIINYSC